MCFAQKPDLCILDVAMPAGSLRVDDRSTGFEVCRRLKRDPRTERIPVIFVTALNDTTDRVKAIEAGGDDFLTKPHNRQILSARVRSLLRLKFATDALDDSYRKLRELEKVRDDLMKMIVHDLKTPLTSVLGVAGDGARRRLRRGERDAAPRPRRRRDEGGGSARPHRRPARGGAHRRERDRPRSRSRSRRARFVGEIVHEWDVRFQQEGAKVFVDVADDAPVIEADKGLLKRVFANLIQNALTHTASGVEITILAHKDTATGGILFTVADNGPGIPPEYHELIFRKFERAKQPEVPRVRSSGLGLAFCKLAVEVHGGRIWVRSTEGQGSQFHICASGAAARAPLAAPRGS